MSLRVRLNLLITAMFVLTLVLGAALVIHNARRAVLDETQSTARLALQLLEAEPSGGEPREESDRTRLTARMRALERARHVRVALVEEGREWPLGGRRQVHAVRAPAWFVRLVEPQAIELRRPIAGASGGKAEIIVRADPADEIAESWEDARTMLALVASVALAANGLLYVAIGRWLRPVEHIVTALNGVEQGDYRARLPAFDLPELASIASRFNGMAAALERSRDENRRLTQQTLAIQEAERRLLAQELHDELGQSISAIKAVGVSITQRGSAESATAAAARTIVEISSQMYAVVGGMMRRLRPTLLDELGLARALEELADSWNDRHTDAFCRLTTRGVLDDLGDELSIGLYRIVQEGLTNVSKHAGAAEVAVDLERIAAPGADRIKLTLRDDGAGFDPNDSRQGLGLVGIRERVHALGGAFSLATEPGKGVRITIEVPVRGGGGGP